MKKLLMFICAIFIMAGTAYAVPIQFDGNGHWYDVVTSPMDWTDANDAANSMSYNGISGHLATITSQEENFFIFNMLQVGSNPYWLGGFQTDDAAEPDKDWQWVTGEEWVYQNWAGGEPNNSTSNNEDALAFAFFAADGTWNDAPKSWVYSNGGFIVEYEPVPEPGTIVLLGAGLFGLVCYRRKIKK